VSFQATNGLTYQDSVVDGSVVLSEDLYVTQSGGSPADEEWIPVLPKVRKGHRMSKQAAENVKGCPWVSSEAAKNLKPLEDPLLQLRTRSTLKLKSTAKLYAAQPQSKTASWATVASKPRLPRVEVKPPSPRSLPRLAQGPGWCSPFSLARTTKPRPAVREIPAVVEQISIVPKESEIVAQVRVSPTSSPSKRRAVSWSDDHQNQPLAQIREIENCLAEKWDWSRCTDLSSTEGKTSMAAAATWYGLIALGMVVNSWVF